MTYFAALTDAMTMLSKQRNAIFIGQGVGCAGTSMTDTLKDVPKDKLLEFPVAEDLQMGFAIGLAIEGYLPICIYPRWNFLGCAFNQLVNHLDRIPIYSGGKLKPKLIIRTAVPSKHPFDPGSQHDDDFTVAFTKMFRTVVPCVLSGENDIAIGYQDALERDGPTLLVEYAEHYRTRTPSGVMG